MPSLQVLDGKQDKYSDYMYYTTCILHTDRVAQEFRKTGKINQYLSQVVGWMVLNTSLNKKLASIIMSRQASTERKESTEKSKRLCGWLPQERKPTGTQERGREKNQNMWRVKHYKGRHDISIAHETDVLRGEVALGSFNGRTSSEERMNY